MVACHYVETPSKNWQSRRLGMRGGLGCSGVHPARVSHMDWGLAFLCLSSPGFWEQEGYTTYSCSGKCDSSQQSRTECLCVKL